MRCIEPQVADFLLGVWTGPTEPPNEPDPSATSIEIWDSVPGTWRTAILKARHYSAAAVTSPSVEAQKVHQHHPWIVEFQNGRLPYRGRTGTCCDQLGVYIPGQWVNLDKFGHLQDQHVVYEIDQDSSLVRWHSLGYTAPSLNSSIHLNLENVTLGVQHPTSPALVMSKSSMFDGPGYRNVLWLGRGVQIGPHMRQAIRRNSTSFIRHPDAGDIVAGANLGGVTQQT